MLAAPAKERLAFLDVARGVAAVVVLFEHGLEHCLDGYLDWSRTHFNLGKIGVILFLLVSGFIIPLSLEQSGSNARFWLRRSFRLFPLYWLSIAIALAYASLGGQYVVGVPMVDAGDWLINTTMLQGFLRRPHVWGVFWTLQLELVIYIACSLLFTVGLLKRTALLAGLALAGCTLLGLARPLLVGQPFDVEGVRILYFAPLIGMVCQRFLASRERKRREWFAAIVFGQAVMVLAVWSVNHFLFPDRITPGALWDMAYNWLPAYACFFALVALRHRPMPEAGCWLGRVSYSLYLLHPFVLALLLSASCPAWLMLPALVGGAIVLSAATYYLVEAPSIAWGRKLERRIWPVAAAIQKPAEATRKAA